MISFLIGRYGKLRILIGRKRIKGIVKFSERITLIVSCYMDLAFYPFDYQTCPNHLVKVLSRASRTGFSSTGPALRIKPIWSKKLHLDFQQVNLNYHGIIKVNLDGLSLTGLPGLKSHEKNSDSDNESIQKFKSLEMPDFSWACLTRVVRAVRIRNWSNTDGQTERVSADKLLKSKY